MFCTPQKLLYRGSKLGWLMQHGTCTTQTLQNSKLVCNFYLNWAGE